MLNLFLVKCNFIIFSFSIRSSFNPQSWFAIWSQPRSLQLEQKYFAIVADFVRLWLVLVEKLKRKVNYYHLLPCLSYLFF